MRCNSLAALLLAMILSTGALAEVGKAAVADAGPIKVLLSGHRVVKADGQDKLVEAKTARPGDVIEYRAVYSNSGKAEVRSVLATLPVPRGMEYVPGSAQPGAVQASLDGRSFAEVPLKRWVVKEDGKRVQEEVPVAEYVALRWRIDTLKAGQDTAVVARMRVQNAVPAATQTTTQ